MVVTAYRMPYQPRRAISSVTLAGSTRRAGGGGMAMAGLSRLPRWPPRAPGSCTMPSLASSPKQKPLAVALGVFALVVVGLAVVTGGMAPGIEL
jgi:hypothetical protein